MQQTLRMILGRIVYVFIIPWVSLFANANRAYVLLFDKTTKEVLFVKNVLGGRAWSLPGGGQKEAETSLETACREVKEEVSLELDPVKLTELCRLKGASRLRRGQRVYFVYSLSRRQITYNQREILKVAWQPIHAKIKLKKDLQPVLTCFLKN